MCFCGRTARKHPPAASCGFTPGQPKRGGHRRPSPRCAEGRLPDGLERLLPGSCGTKADAAASPSGVYQGTVTGVPSRHALEIDGIPRHVRDLRHRLEQEESREQAQPEDDSDDELVLHFAHPKAQSMPREEEPLTTCLIGEFEALPARLKRSSRVRKARTCACCDT
ncbi:hypothetical protein TTRE_0000924401 [Trichuris trichiura]|uniref:Uncharacterized protein n=1 Tax=Trichuris trichiura TaxID=36087 RepID=A0A077ZKF1_TRITR|nr:hypothetical protein TTRE_0000924401 [Trichuris trichiura]